MAASRATTQRCLAAIAARCGATCSRLGSATASRWGGALDRATAFVRLAPGDDNELRLAVQWFGCALVGLALPLAAQTQAVWDVAPRPEGEPGSWGGHAVAIVGYDPGALTGVSWGAVKHMTWRFWRAYASEAWAVLSADWIARGGASPAGIALDTLRNDLSEMTA